MDGLFFIDKICCRVVWFIILLVCIEYFYIVYFYWWICLIVWILGVLVSEGDWGFWVILYKYVFCFDVVFVGLSCIEVFVIVV